MRILHVVPTLRRGGAERELTVLVCNSSREFEHVVCCLHVADGFAPQIRAAGCEVVELGLPMAHAWFAGAKRVARLMRRVRADIVQPWMFDACITARLASLIGPPTKSVYALQDLVYEPEIIRLMGFSPWRVGLRKTLDRATALWTDPMVVTPSLAWEQAARRHLGLRDGRVQTIYNSINPSDFEATADDAVRVREELGISPTATVFLNVGRLQRQKGQRYLLEAFAQVVERVPDSNLVIVGDGPLRGPLTAHASELGIAARVRFTGVRTDVGSFLRAADIFVFPSIHEGLGLALVEAMCTGMPCIASKVPAIQEVIRSDDEGVLVPAADPSAIAEAMIALQRDPGRRVALSATGMPEARRRFGVHSTIPQWERLYREVLARPAS